MYYMEVAKFLQKQANIIHSKSVVFKALRPYKFAFRGINALLTDIFKKIFKPKTF
jgi:hypothetical protein